MHSTVENTDEYQNGDEDDEQIDNLEEYGFRQDCSVFEGMASYAEYVAGSTIEAAALLADDAFDVVIHWDGGRHHAQKDRAEGFCYISDVVLGIIELQKEFPKVMYIDLDVHHGDGVENAFQVSDKVLTVSLHHFAEGFYPGTGSGKNLSPRSKAVVNIPLKAGLSDGNLNRIFDGMIEPLKESFSPDAIVLQCGVDGMAGDPLGKWNLGFDGYSHCLRAILSWKKPLIVLGGGGYKNSSAARCYAYLTSVVLGRDISADIPEHEYFEDYAPDFQLQVEPRRQPDENTKEYLEVVQALVIEQSKNVQLTSHNRV
ncbi:Histone deacetylase 8 [Podila verticillata]|nr:Histone deacetylase 8 [Podila verticillata]